MRLDIYLADHCDNCQEAQRLAALAAAVPGVQVNVVNLDAAAVETPFAIVAVPTYVLDGRIISLGNPYASQLLDLLQPGDRWDDERDEKEIHG
jgi:predicted carbohydrate-binding protein with CBM5 and CBM33 domain